MDRSDVLAGENGSLDFYVLNFYTLEPVWENIAEKSHSSVSIAADFGARPIGRRTRPQIHESGRLLVIICGLTSSLT